MHLEKSLPPDNLLKSLHRVSDPNTTVAHNVDAEIQWDSVTSDIPHLIKLIIEKGIEYNKERLVSYGLMSFNSLLQIAKNTTLTDSQEDFIITDLHGDIGYLTVKIAKSPLATVISGDCGHSMTLQDILEKKKPYIEHLVRTSLEVIAELQQNQKLDLGFGRVTFLKGPTRLLIQLHVPGDGLSGSIDEILNLIVWLRRQFEQSIKETPENYLELYSILTSLTEFVSQTHELHKNLHPIKKTTGQIDNSLINKIKSLGADFTKLTEARKFRKELYRR